MTSAAWVHEEAGRETFSWCHYIGGTSWLYDTHFTELSHSVLKYVYKPQELLKMSETGDF